MRYDAPRYDPERSGQAIATDCDAYAHAERMLDRHGIAYIRQHPEILLGRLPAIASEHRVRTAYRDLAYDLPGMYARTGSGAHLAGEGDLLMRIVKAYQMLDEIYLPYRAPTRAGQPSTKGDTSTSTNTGDQW